MKETGWIKLNRKILDWRWYTDSNTFRVFLHLLLTANVKEADFQRETIRRGEVVVSIGNLGKSTGLTYNQVRTALTHLKETNEITIARRPKYLVISIVNYDKYQDNHTQTTNESQSNHNQTTIKPQQSKNKKNKKKNKNIYIYDECERADYGNLYLSDEEWDELAGLVNDDGEFIKIIDRVSEWLGDNPRPKETHKSIVKTFMRNDGWIE